MLKRKQRIVVKVGSNVLAQNNGELDLKSIEQLTRQIALLKKQDIEIAAFFAAMFAWGF